MKIKPYLLTTAVVELAAGLALLIVPGVVVGWLLGNAPLAPEALVLARFVGVALLAIGMACGLARDDPGGSARRGVVVAALFYDVAVALLFVATAVGAGLAGPLLWPAVVLHTALAVWGLFCLTDRADAEVQRGGAR
jgi:hypothetical protein